ncbi:hypothetical protein [Flavobacterium cerinum]|uniref:Uncharacterized protein n=1 Tax=Flavobacterium cerinum TaxID=2502784 RepID=A0A444GLP1_9FLAO|nr:hypothetical protein [Flavobacterium cerinum]RWW91847.1 hypothetical protein EPI11_17550 [Flavobacterium cerinum]
MLRIFTLLFLMAIAPATAQGVTGDMIKDIVFKTEKELTAKYGKPEKEISKPGDVLAFGSYSLTWVKDKKQITVFYEDDTFKKVESIALYAYVFNKDTFYKSFGWDKPVLNEDTKEIKVSGLNGFKAYYVKRDKMFMISLLRQNPNIKTFGKKK